MPQLARGASDENSELLISNEPKIGLFNVESPEIVAWDFEQYARLLKAAKGARTST